jgi:hypothetical protein
LLHENPQRFVLFPIQHHDVCYNHNLTRLRRVHVQDLATNTHLGLAHV